MRAALVLARRTRRALLLPSAAAGHRPRRRLHGGGRGPRAAMAEGGASAPSSSSSGRVADLWLDCDPGHDDAMAIILAAYHPKVNLLGVSCVASNQTVDKTAQNALDVLHAIGRRELPARPLMRDLVHCEAIHGDSGLDGPGGGPLLPRSPEPLAGSPAVPAMREAIAEAFGGGVGGRPSREVHLVCTGALTNAALLLTLYPEVREMVRVTIMGGAVNVGNTSPAAEFNIETDPEAAHIVFNSGVPLTMVPLEVTHEAQVTPEVLARVTSSNTRFAKSMGDLLTFFATTYKEVFDFDHPPLHDPCAVAHVIDAGMFVDELMRVDIETAGLCAGRTVCDIYRKSKEAPNCVVAKEIDTAKFWDMMITAIRRADEASPLR